MKTIGKLFAALSATALAFAFAAVGSFGTTADDRVGLTSGNDTDGECCPPPPWCFPDEVCS